MNPIVPLAAAGVWNEGGFRTVQNVIRPVSVALASGLLVILSACGAAPPREEPESTQAIPISGLVIRNELTYPVTDVMIEAPASGSFAGCGTVLPRTGCSNVFQRVDYRGKAVVVRWKEHGQPYQTDEFTMQPPPDARAGDEFRIEVIVFAPGQAGARLMEVKPGEVRNR